MKYDKPYKHDKIKAHFEEWIQEQTQDWIDENLDDLHHHAFNTDYYVIGTYQAKQWLGDQAFNIINQIKEYEMDNFGQVYCDFSDPEKVLNMYVYIVGEQIIYDWIAKTDGKITNPEPLFIDGQMLPSQG